jgi:hypothetical protein
VSYSVNIFHVDVRRKIEEGQKLDGFSHPELKTEDMKRLIKRLGLYGYQPVGQQIADALKAKPLEFVKQVGTCPITVTVFPSQVSFSVPYWEGSQDAILEALQDASELSDSESLALHNPQLNAWSDG